MSISSSGYNSAYAMERTDGKVDRATGSHRTGKVERLIEEYDLVGIGDELVEAWAGTNGEQLSLRELAKQFNRQLLRTEMNELEATAREYDLDSVYRVLRDETVSSGKRARVRSQLEEDGIDLAALDSDFVSHLAIRTYLKHRGTTREESTIDQVKKESQRIQRLRSRATTVTESKLDQLRETDRIAVGNTSVLTEITVFCEDCGTQYGIDELLTERTCDCFAEDDLTR